MVDLARKVSPQAEFFRAILEAAAPLQFDLNRMDEAECGEHHPSLRKGYVCMCVHLFVFACRTLGERALLMDMWVISLSWMMAARKKIKNDYFKLRGYVGS